MGLVVIYTCITYSKLAVCAENSTGSRDRSDKNPRLVVKYESARITLIGD